MKPNTLDLITQTVAKAKTYPNATIEYNFDELPDHPEIKPDSFFGVDAYMNDSRSKDTCNVLYKLS